MERSIYPLQKALGPIIDSVGFVQHVSEPTHFHNHTLDLVLSHGIDIVDLNVFFIIRPPFYYVCNRNTVVLLLKPKSKFVYVDKFLPGLALIYWKYTVSVRLCGCFILWQINSKFWCSSWLWFRTNWKQLFSLYKAKSMWILCARGNCHAETGKGLPQTVATKLEAQNVNVCCSIKISLHLKGPCPDHEKHPPNFTVGTMHSHR
jgi:hypothetical protein